MATDASNYTIDEYVWLDGKPVAMLRSKYQVAGQYWEWAREAGWGSGQCACNDGTTPCSLEGGVQVRLGSERSG